MRICYPRQTVHSPNRHRKTSSAMLSIRFSLPTSMQTGKTEQTGPSFGTDINTCTSYVFFLCGVSRYRPIKSIRVALLRAAAQAGACCARIARLRGVVHRRPIVNRIKPHTIKGKHRHRSGKLFCATTVFD